MTRGIVLPLTAQQRVTRMRWLAGEATLGDDLGSIAITPPIAGYTRYTDDTRCATGYYRLNGDHDKLPAYNGGKDPTAIDPFDRWRKPGSTFVNVTADCIGGMAWCGGFDRYQTQRFAHLYDGWINTDSMVMDARGPKRCFKLLNRPEPGCFVVFTSGSGGHKVGHIGGITSVPAEWDPARPECWRELGVVDVASRIGRANARGNGLTWFNTRGVFVISTMTP